MNYLIDKEVNERDYTELRDKLREQNQPKERQFEPIDSKPIQTALLAYDLLTRQEKKEFWGRVIGTITITNDDHFFVEPIRHK